MAEYLQLPRLDATTTEGRLKQLESFTYILVETFNRNVDEIKHKEANDGKNIHDV